MVLKWWFLKHFRSCLNRTVQVNYVSAFIVGATKLVFQRNVGNLTKLRNPTFKYGMLLSAAAAVSTLYYNNSMTEEDVQSNLAHLMQLAKLALENGDIERAEQILKVGLKLSEEHKIYTGYYY